jgi:alpha-galactosidase
MSMKRSSVLSRITYWFAVVTLFAVPLLLGGQDPGAMNDARRWVSAKFLGKVESSPARGYLVMHERSAPVLRNEIQGHPLRIGTKEYSQGLHFSSVGDVDVHLPKPGKSFDAIVGVDSNDLGYYSNRGRGSVVASVVVGDRELFRSTIIHEGTPGVPIHVNLPGATDFTMRLRRVGPRKPWDDPGWDQADWARAEVLLSDGSIIELADLPGGPLAGPHTAEAPFSFRYGGQPSNLLLQRWNLRRSKRTLNKEAVEYTSTYTDPNTRLVVRSVGVAYSDFPTVEWTLYFKNAGTQRTPTLENIEALDTRLERNSDGEFILHTSKGSQASAADYEPLETVLGPKSEKRMTSAGGRPTDGNLCYFDIEWPGEGAIVALGWPGRWAARFTRDEGTGLQIAAGQELTHFTLLPGEEVRTPLVALQFWRGDWIGAQNVWRRWMIAHNLPRPNGRRPPPQLASSSGRFTIEMQEANEENQKSFLDRYLEDGIKLDYWWMDAGWYRFESHWWNTGTWQPDPQRFPHGLRSVSDYAHARGVKTIVWFELERVTRGSWLWDHHPDWLLKCPEGERLRQRLLNLGNPQARQGVVDYLTRFLRQQGIDTYRIDFNIDPLPFWRANDAPDRQGITEIKYVTGFLDYLDALRRTYPGLLIDTCASGGRRNDLETLRRAVPLWRSDFAYEPTAMQDLTYGISLWIPFFGTAINSDDPYVFRSQMTPAVGLGVEPDREDVNYVRLRKLLLQWRQVAPDYYGDYYPLTAYTPANNAWVAWQFNRPKEGQGMLQVFRRPDSPYESARFRLRALDPTALYSVINADSDQKREMKGKELEQDGLPISLGKCPGSALIVYERIRIRSRGFAP